MPSRTGSPRRPRRAAQPFEVRDSPIQGKGAFATRDIEQGDRIIEYVGERIGPDVADERYDDDVLEHAHTFLFTVDDDTIVDATFGGNDSRFINHSCGPNCEAVIEEGRIYIEALRDIAEGEELSYDYQLEREGRFRAEWWSRYACRCGSANCRGIILNRHPKKRPAAGGAKKGAKKKAPKRA